MRETLQMAIFQQAANEPKWTPLKSERHLKSILIFRILLLLLILPHSLLFTFNSTSHALDEGGGTIEFEYRSIDQDTFLYDQTQYEAISHLDLWQNVPNVGRFSLWIDWANAGGAVDLSGLGREETVSINKLGRGYLALEGFRLDHFVFDGLAGDSSVTFTNLPDIFSNLFCSDIYFQGLRADAYSPSGEVHVFGGKVVRVVGLFGSIYDTTDESFYGFKSSYRIAPWILLGTGFIRTQDEVDLADRPVTHSNNILLLDSEMQVFDWMKWLAEFRRSDYTGVAGVQDEKGYAFVLGPMIRINNFKLQANYRRIGTDYRFVNEATQGLKDQQGLFVLAEYTPWQDVTLFGNLDRFHNNVSDESDRNTLDTLSGLLGFSFFNPAYPSLFVTYSVLDQETRFSFPNPVSTSTGTLASELQYQYKSFNPYLRYRRINYADGITPMAEYVENAVTLGFRQDFGTGIWAYLEGQTDQKKYHHDEKYTQLYGKVGFNYYYSSELSSWGEFIYGKLKDRTEDSRVGKIEGSFGLTYQLPWGIQVQGDIRYDRIVDPPKDWMRAQNLQVTFQIAKQFGWGKPPEIAGLKPGEGSSGYGTVDGFVFNDINRNGTQDKGEEGVQNVTLRLEDRSATKTNENGYYQFSRVEVGGHLVTLDVRRIPAEYSIISPEKVGTEVRLRETLKINFPLITVGRIEGRIIFDANGNGERDPDEQGVPDVLVVLEPGDLNTYTDEDGKYALENVLPGKYVMTSDPTTLPEDAVFTSSAELRFEVPVGGELKDMDFLIFVKPRRIIIGPPTK
jgi:hypothetical protein